LQSASWLVFIIIALIHLTRDAAHLFPSFPKLITLLLALKQLFLCVEEDESV
jgi:hypothetical protein